MSRSMVPSSNMACTASATGALKAESFTVATPYS